MTRTLLIILSSAFLVMSLALLPINASVSAQEQGGRNRSSGRRFRMVEPNLYAPDLYTDALKAQFTLVNLPGASEQGSRWEVSYHIYFIPEEEYWKVMRSVQSLDDAEQFPEKILLAEGHFTRINLSTLRARTYTRRQIPFKAKVPQQDRTKFAMLMTSYSVKIYDARLKTPIYYSSLFLTEPFTDDTAQTNKALPRTTLYTNFAVTPRGLLLTSQLPQRANDLKWGQ